METALARDEARYTLLLPGGVEGKAFHGNFIPKAIGDIERNGYVPLFVPQIIDAKIEATEHSKIWKNNYFTASISATGRTKQGNAVVVYTHLPNYFSNLNNIIQAREESLEKGYATMPQEEFQRLVDSDGAVDQHGDRAIWVIDYEKVKDKSGFHLSVDQALEHPQTIPFFGGEKRAVKYLRRHKEIFGNEFSVLHSEGLYEQPVGHLLVVRRDFFDINFKGLPDMLWGDFYFIGVPPEKMQKLVLVYNPDDVEKALKSLEKLSGFVKEDQLSALEHLLRKL